MGSTLAPNLRETQISIPQNKKSPVVFVKYINEQREIRDCISRELSDQLLMPSLRKALCANENSVK